MKKEINVEFAQQQLLGSIIYRPDKAVEVIDKINPEIFSTKEYSEIYKCIIALYQENKQINDATILDRACYFNYDITPELVKKLANNTVFVTKKNLKSYVEIIKEANAKRKTVEKLNNFLEQSQSSNFSHTKFVEELSGLAISLTDTIKAESCMSDVYVESKSYLDELDFRRENPNFIKGIPFGIPTMDAYSDGAVDNEIITIGGDSNSGKTQIALVILLNMARFLVENKINKKLLYISLEMTKKQLQTRLISIVSGIRNSYIKNPKKYFVDNNLDETNEDIWNEFKQKITDAINYINSLPIIIDDSSELSFDEISAKARKVQLKDGLTCTFIDYIGKVNNGLEDWSDISESYKKAEILAKNTLSPIIILNQYNSSDIKGLRNIGYKPNQYCMAGGKQPVNSSNKIFHIWRPEKYDFFIKENPQYKGKVIVINDKLRDGKEDDYMPDLELIWEGGNLVENTCFRTPPSINVMEKVFRGAN